MSEGFQQAENSAVLPLQLEDIVRVLSLKIQFPQLRIID